MISGWNMLKPPIFAEYYMFNGAWAHFCITKTIDQWYPSDLVLHTWGGAKSAGPETI